MEYFILTWLDLINEGELKPNNIADGFAMELNNEPEVKECYVLSTDRTPIQEMIKVLEDLMFKDTIFTFPEITIDHIKKIDGSVDYIFDGLDKEYNLDDKIKLIKTYLAFLNQKKNIIKEIQ